MADDVYFASCTRGIEPAVAAELRDLGCDDLEERAGGVAFRGSREFAYRATLWLRSAIRVQQSLADATVHNADDLHAAVAALPWETWLSPDQTLAVFATVRDTPSLRHSGFVALRIKDGVVDRMRARCGRRPSVDTKHPDLPIKAVLRAGRLRLYRDLAGTSLHKRGWRPIQVKSPLNEATAAGLLLLSGWDRRAPLADPMCGSGTFLVEAAWMAMDRAPGLERAFAFEQWIDHDVALWDRLREEARQRVRAAPDVCLEGADHHEGALSLAARGAQAAGVADVVRFAQHDARDFCPTSTPEIVVTNPPYGQRLGRDEALVESWKSLGNFLHRHCAGATAWVLSGNPELTRFLGLRTSRRIPVMNGPIECRWLRYEIRARAAS